MKKSETITKLAAALNKAQAQLQPAIKDASNPFFHSRYADLESCWEAVRKPFTSNGLSIVQLPCMLGDKPALETTLLHESGEWISEAIQLFPVKLDSQAIGSALTYSRRYGLASITGLVQSDDDGNIASGKNHQPQPAQAPKMVTPPPSNPMKMASEAQVKMVWAKLKNELNFDDESAKTFIQRLTNKLHTKDLLATDINILVNEIAKRKSEQPDNLFPNDEWHGQ